jgi:hypothetical protein
LKRALGIAGGVGTDPDALIKRIRLDASHINSHVPALTKAKGVPAATEPSPGGSQDEEEHS